MNMRIRTPTFLAGCLATLFMLPFGCERHPTPLPADATLEPEQESQADDTVPQADSAPAGESVLDTSPLTTDEDAERTGNEGDRLEATTEVPPTDLTIDIAEQKGPNSEALDDSRNAPESTTEKPLSSANPEFDSTVRRVVFLATGAPLIVDLQLRHGNQSAASGWETAMCSLIDIADKDGDGKTNWDELLDSAALLTLAFGNQPFAEGDQRRTIAMSYDSTGDQYVQPEELARFLGRSFRSQENMLVRSESFDPLQRVNNSPVKTWLDVNKDGILSSEDKANAADRLRQLDADGDGRLWPGDFGDFNRDSNGMVPGYGSVRRGPLPVRMLSDDSDWNEITTDLEDVYAFGSDVTADDMVTMRGLFQALDVDEDDVLQVPEVARLATVPADLAIQLELQSGMISGWTFPQRLVHEQDPNASAASDASDSPVRQALVDLDSLLLSVQIETGGKEQAGSNDDGLMGYGAYDAIVLLNRGDTDKNRALNEGEFLSLGFGTLFSFSQLDKDKDGQVIEEELSVLSRLFQSFAKSGTLLDVRPFADPVFAALDADRSGSLDAREMEVSGEQLTAMDSNRDGNLGTHELPFVLFVRLSDRPAYGNVASPRPVAMGVMHAANLGQAPVWFTQMDFNRDGEIGRNEFLGDGPLFDRLDLDADGYLEATEANNP